MIGGLGGTARRAVRLAATVAALLCAAVQQPAGQQRPAAPPLPRLDRVTEIPLALFRVPDGFEVTLWAGTPMVRNPTNIDVDRDGRIWVAEGVRYRNHHDRQPAGDRIVVLQDTDGDGRADASHTFVQEPALIAPLGVAVGDVDGDGARDVVVGLVTVSGGAPLPVCPLPSVTDGPDAA